MPSSSLVEVEVEVGVEVGVEVEVRSKLYQQVFYFGGRVVVGWGGVEKWRLKLTSAIVGFEVEAELGNIVLAESIANRFTDQN